MGEGTILRLPFERVRRVLSPLLVLDDYTDLAEQRSGYIVTQQAGVILDNSVLDIGIEHSEKPVQTRDFYSIPVVYSEDPALQAAIVAGATHITQHGGKRVLVTHPGERPYLVRGSGLFGPENFFYASKNDILASMHHTRREEFDDLVEEIREELSRQA